MWTSEFWKQTLERAIKTAAQAGLAFFVVGETMITDMDWQAVASAAVVGAVASVLTSLASSPFGPEFSPSVVKADEKDVEWHEHGEEEEVG